jgi:hypothetical protein
MPSSSPPSCSGLSCSQVECSTTTFDPARVVIDQAHESTVRRPDPFTRDDLDGSSEGRAQRNGTYRAVADRLLAGKRSAASLCGPRPDDPNDIVPHELAARCVRYASLAPGRI